MNPVQEFITRLIAHLEHEAKIEKAQGYDARAQGIRTAIVIVIRESIAQPKSEAGDGQ